MQNLEAFKKVYFQIADHIVELSMPKCVEVNRLLPSFVDFLVKSPKYAPVIKIILCLDKETAINTNTRLLSDISVVWGDKFRFEESEEEYITSIKGKTRSEQWKMYSSKDFITSTIYAVKSEIYSSETVSWLIMIAYAQGILNYDTILIHASVVEKDGLGYAFLGKSGTGKSTHSRMWMDNIQKTSLLNDDNPIIRINNDNILIFGSPWSGKTSCYINKGVELKALVRLEQASENSWKYLSGKNAFVALMPSCSAIRWSGELFNKMLDSVEKIIKNTIIGNLSCLPNKESAILCNRSSNEKIT